MSRIAAGSVWRVVETEGGDIIPAASQYMYVYLPSKHTSRCMSRTDRCRKKESATNHIRSYYASPWLLLMWLRMARPAFQLCWQTAGVFLPSPVGQ